MGNAILKLTPNTPKPPQSGGFGVYPWGIILISFSFNLDLI
jgi:hypothetical protein